MPDQDFLIIGARGTGKTLQISLLEGIWVAAFDDCEILSAGAIEEQADRCFDYFTDLIQLPVFASIFSPGLAKTRNIRLKNKSSIKIVPGTVAQMNGPHPQKLVLDELELFNPAALRESTYMTKDNRGIKGQTIKTTSRKYAFGLAEKELQAIDKFESDTKLMVWCLDARELIWVNGALRKIEDVDIGDNILSLNGNWDKVTNKKTRKSDRVGINLFNMKRDPLILSPDHDCLVVKKNDAALCVHKINKTGARSSFSGMQTNHNNPKVNWQRGQAKITKIRASGIECGDYMLFPIIEKRQNPKQLCMPEGVESVYWKSKKYRTSRFFRGLPLTPDTSWLYGLWIAEGHLSDTGVGWTLSSREIDMADRVKKIVMNVFGLKCNSYFNRDNTIVLRVSNPCLSLLFNYFFGRGCQNKKLPEGCLGWEGDLQLALFNGVYDGDGFKGRQRGLATTSRELAFGLYALSIQLVKNVSIQKNPAYVGGDGVARRESWRLLWRKSGSCQSFFEPIGEVNYFWSCISHLDLMGDGLVVDISTESQTFTTRLGVVHNCLFDALAECKEVSCNPCIARKRADGKSFYDMCVLTKGKRDGPNSNGDDEMRAKKARGHYSLTDAWKKFRDIQTDPSDFDSQMLSRSPSKEGLIYPMLDARVHLKEPDYFKKRMEGMVKPYAMTLVVDPGYRDPAVVAFAIQLGEDICILDEIYETRLHPDEVFEKTQMVLAVNGWKEIETIFDPSDPGKIRTWGDAGFSVSPAFNDVESGIAECQSRFRWLPGPEDDSVSVPPTFYISTKCKNIWNDLTQWHYKIQKPEELAERARKRPDPRQSDHGCLHESTMINTENGQKKISEVTINDRVWTRQGLRDVLWAGKTGANRNLLKIEFSNGEKILATPDHPVWVDGNGFVDAEKIRVGDKCTKVVVRSIGEVAGRHDVYNISVEGEPEFFANGILVHNCDIVRYLVMAFYNAASGATIIPSRNYLQSNSGWDEIGGDFDGW